jgi:hypothetical protein
MKDEGQRREGGEAGEDRFGSEVHGCMASLRVVMSEDWRGSWRMSRAHDFAHCG